MDKVKTEKRAVSPASNEGEMRMDSELKSRLKALRDAARVKYNATGEPLYEGQIKAYEMAIQVATSVSPKLGGEEEDPLIPLSAVLMIHSLMASGNLVPDTQEGWEAALLPYAQGAAHM